MVRQLFNYYIVLKSCWVILLFQGIGFIALVVLEQGADILRTLAFSAPHPINVHTGATLFAVLWWCWQSWRAARAELHFTTFDFVQFSNRYALQAQVMIPRLLGIMPLFIYTIGLVKATSWNNPMVYLYLSIAVWLYLFFHFRRNLVVFLKSWTKNRIEIPDYILIKNEAYPVSFIWSKQGGWILFRLVCILCIFIGVVISPVWLPQQVGASAVILFALGSWLVIGSFIDFAEKHYHFPFTFTIIIMVIVFSFNNNNHKARTLDKVGVERADLDAHFLSWYKDQQASLNDSVPVIMVAAQGGGVRASYWTAMVLAELQQTHPNFDSSVYAYSTVSGGTLGVATYKSLVRANASNLPSEVNRILSKDFLSPVTSWLVFPDLAQKFLPVPINSIDRARALEYSWEKAAHYRGQSLLEEGFLESTGKDKSAYFYNATKVENGFITLISNVKAPEHVFPLKEDLFEFLDMDIRQSTAIGLSSRFPFLTPPALIVNSAGEKWGSLVDGGYAENMGASTLFELYDHLKDLSRVHQLKTKFILLFIRNTRDEYSTEITGLPELVAPLNTFSKVWINSGYYNTESTKIRNLPGSDIAEFIALERHEGDLIPLGWFLSPIAISSMEGQLRPRTADFKKILNDCFGQLP